ncbi:uncharacterized protein [Dermacentor albipictus]|uniref:uncharacterized protein n=1 Tax=Dermacentor albipictus TaxID=60249 RepID=UPI0031FC8E69
MRAATDLMLSCKDYIMKLNLSPLILKEHRRLCIGMRICYAQLSYHNSTINQHRRSLCECMEKGLYMWQAMNPELLAKLRLNVASLVKAGKTCAYDYFPLEEKYALAALTYFTDFISG